ncbi:SusD/RagB family nutrient-binding outer membrane lipoprotein [Fulvivirga ligni]|uniref:SusD/RagB family nutrient-binding outer membrane lipoprotein n=1 Tax=Fulvivirga ligni TaxID=2904246 RepID=UPI001F2E0EF4|nr:SusD/RagB family nutrient-binding outer membrane lipoprotein [Fulvivirga ligni]UII22884.1 SusD/RagB family nutrient-binding outer membrane lipoprotein [Fulvivirga ligni]
MKKQTKYTLITLMMVAILFGCNDVMEDMQTSDKALNEELLKADALNVKSFIPSLSTNVNNITTSWQYQVEQNLNADHFSGYMMSANPFGLPGTNAHYNINDGWNGWIYTVASTNLTQMVALKREALPEYSDYYSYGLLLKILSALPMVDAFGAFPYKDFGTGTDVQWDNLETIYDEMFSELDFAIDTLSSYVGTERANRISNDVSSYSGDYIKFIKLANTLKLRLAMRISDVAPSKAQTLAEEVIADEYGTLTADDGEFSIVTSYNHPLWQLAAWGDIQMGADVESILGGYQDPRLGEFFSAAADEEVAGEYKGIRQGAPPIQGAYVGFSKPNFAQTAPMVLVTAAEAYFLKAEAALYGWNMGGTAQEFYEEGIKTSFAQYGLEDADDYIKSHLTPKSYTDPKNASNAFAAMTTVTPSWEDATADEERLEKIITQKWIAIFPDGAEAWAEFRRTGYPKLKPIPASQNANIPTGQFIKKLPVPSNVTSVSPTRYQEAKDNFFGGNDNAGTSVWWDVEN